MRITGSSARSRERAAIAVACAFAASAALAAGPDAPELTALPTRVGERVADYYKRGQSIVLHERMTVLVVRHDVEPGGFSRVPSYERVVAPGSDIDRAARATS